MGTQCDEQLEQLYAVMEAAETNQKAAEAVISKLEKLPAAISAEVAEKVSHKATEAAKDLDRARRRLCDAVSTVRSVGAWWPLVLPIFATAFLGLILFVYERSQIRTLGHLKEEIAARSNDLAKLPKVISYTTHNGKQSYGVQVSKNARPIEMTTGIWLIEFE